MTALHAMIANAPDTALALGGLMIGAIFGALLHTTNYCVMGAVSDWQIAGDKGRLGAVALSAATAIVVVQLLNAAGAVDLSRSFYLTPRINWAGAIGGGLLFGIGMVYAGGCPSRSLVRAGSGDVRAIVCLITLAIATYATISGLLGSFRMFLDGPVAIDLKPLALTTQSLPDFLGVAGLAVPLARVLGSIAIAAPLLMFAIGPAKILQNRRNVIAGLGVGLLVSVGWLLTGLAADDLAAKPITPLSLSFVRPVADAIDWIERSTALGLPGFGAASVFGVMLGGFASTFIKSGFKPGGVRLSGFADAQDLIRHMFGAIAMGIGGVLALGCSIGQGVTGISTLSAQSLLACAAIIAGTVLGLKLLERSL